MKILIAIAMLLSSGCAYITKAEDAFLGQMVKQGLELCEKPYHRRLGYYIILEGEFSQVGIGYGGFICPGDPETEEE